jgi:hypothetical protein
MSYFGLDKIYWLEASTDGEHWEKVKDISTVYGDLDYVAICEFECYYKHLNRIKNNTYNYVRLMCDANADGNVSQELIWRKQTSKSGKSYTTISAN